VANSAAARIYHESRYEKACVVQKGPATCIDLQRALQELKAANEVADAVVKIGAMPAQEKAELAALLAKVGSLP
jgi:hypothetical protein